MSITSQILDQFPLSTTVTYPVLRQLKDSYGDQGPLVVLFTDEERGVALSGTHPNRLGKPETWLPHWDGRWTRASISLTSKD